MTRLPGGSHYNVTSVRCHTLKQLFDLAGLRRVNYISMDLEGGEAAVVESFPFNDYDADVLQIETHMQGCVHESCIPHIKFKSSMPAPLGVLESLGSVACAA